MLAVMNNDGQESRGQHRSVEARGMLAMLIEHVIHLDTPSV